MRRIDFPPVSSLKLTAKTIVIAAVGAVVFVLLGIPLPLLLGPMVACLIAALIGTKMKDLGSVGTFLRTFLGVTVGASITPALVYRLPEMGLSLIFVPLFILLIGAVGYPFLRYVFGLDHPTSFYAAMPGGLQDMLVFGEEAGGDLRAMSLIHATRVLVIVTMAPLFLSQVWSLDLTLPPGASASSIPSYEIAIMIAAGFVGWKVGERVGLFGASILGPLILTAILSLTGIIEHRPPAEIIWIAQFSIGIAVGVKYTGVTAQELRSYILAGVGYSILAALISIFFIVIVANLGVAPKLESFLAFLPGGQAEMAVISIIAGADLAFVVTHHILRIIVVITIAPLIAKLVTK